ncbi:AAA family [Apiospora hydei]|uniref:AAA family n=1 Tax=Apiospora hydei TaxID=1337664 RepID=A0ABR1VJG8_9PEZI
MSLEQYRQLAPASKHRGTARNGIPLLKIPSNSRKKAKPATPSSSDQGDDSDPATPTTPANGYSFVDITERTDWLHDSPTIIRTFASKRSKLQKDKYDQYSFVVRRREKKNRDGTWSSIGTTLEIRESEIANALRSILKHLRYINLQSEVVKLPYPYRELFWFAKELESFRTSTGEEMKDYEGFQVLHRNAIGDHITKLRMEPASVVVLEEMDLQRAYVVRSVDIKSSKDGDYIEVHCYGWNCDETHFGLCERTIEIPSFDGTWKILDLHPYPLECLGNLEKTEVLKRLTSSGRKWQLLLGPRHHEHHGTARVLQRKGDAKREDKSKYDLDINGESLYQLIPIHIEGRIVLDHDTCLEENRESVPSLLMWTPVSQHSELAVTDLMKSDKDLEGLWYKYPRQSNYQISDLQALICPPSVRGFALEDKVWADFQIAKVNEIKWNLDSFKLVQLDSRIKEAVESLVHMHSKASKGFQDFVVGKSKGLVLLLHGPPGTGKTLTAETLSESTQRPLFRVTSGELGITPDQAEEELKHAFRLAGKWNAMLLLDEADVFLSARKNSDVARNGFVSVFLRTMEWFQGIMLMTTNREQDFDEAFKSRIHLSIPYSLPGHDARKEIWKNIVREQQVEHDLTSESFDRLSEDTQMNGRQIKNLVRVAIALSQSKGINLSERMIRHAQQLRMSFSTESG